jgi:hypothetical protein
MLAVFCAAYWLADVARQGSPVNRGKSLNLRHMPPCIGSWLSIDLNRLTCRLQAPPIAYMTEDKRFI